MDLFSATFCLHSNMHDIDLPLYKYGLIYKFDLNNNNLSEKTKRVRKYKSYLICLIFIVHIINLSVGLLSFKFKSLSNYNFNIIQYFGGIPEFIYLLGILGSIHSLYNIFLFNFNQNNYIKWFDIVKDVKQIKTNYSIGINKEILRNQYVYKIRITQKLINIMLLFSDRIVLLISVFVPIYYLKLSEGLVKLSMTFMSSAIYCLASIFMIRIACFCFLYYFIICFYFKLRFKSFKYYISEVEKENLLNTKTSIKILVENNSDCKRTTVYNKFWRNYYFCLNYTIMPINLMFLQIIFFENTLFMLYYLIIILCICSLSAHFSLNLIIASINKEATDSYNQLLQLYLKSNSKICTKIKLKVFILIYLYFQKLEILIL